ncbi:MAG TPA: 4-hydroxy-3-methylbut-2-enyl diphosphate reductase [Bacteroidia bacterium]|jgi:4-hydroxy-3-methylbut-2-enyl diphosphate reductase|nr:4-hydroxy-3-methylbut-2-enyl diphosphate reductase [Bacteroidia bacterium]
MKTFEIPEFYKSPLLAKVKERRSALDQKKKDFSPTLLDFGSVRFLMARHFGFCYGVQNAIELSFRAVKENPGKRIFLLSQMIHNQEVNANLQDMGVQFLMDTYGNTITPFDELTPDDVVIIPAFGTTLDIKKQLADRGIEIKTYDTTCPFVHRVWNKAEKLGSDKFTVIIHGRPYHEETRATFSHSAASSPSLIVKDMSETKILGDYMLGKISRQQFEETFEGRYSDNFDPDKSLEKIGVINQTTMLAEETQGIADYLKNIILEKYGPNNLKEHVADTRDTLCYATNENQDATHQLLKQYADIAIVVGGYNSSNTSHIVELCEKKFPTFFISSAKEIESQDTIHHFDIHKEERKTTLNFLPDRTPLTVVLTSGASCPDAMVEEVLLKILSYCKDAKPLIEVMQSLD